MGFCISTSLGKYNPDWAIFFHEGTVKNIYFVAEIKGSDVIFQLRRIKTTAKDSVSYDVVNNYKELLNRIMR